MTRKHGSQLVDEDKIGTPEFDDLYAEAKKALDTPLVHACNEALELVSIRFGVRACDPDGGECSFPQCLVLGCEGEPRRPPVLAKKGMRRR